jgi:chemotaxis protein methyltransferase WspC
MSGSTVRQWLLEHTPLEPSLLEGAGFAALVAERIATVARGDESLYIAALGQSPDEVERLTAGVAVPETWLFRYPSSFELLVDVLRHQSAAKSLRMCSVGCATGLEPYSMAMAAVHAGWSPDRVRIDAFDRNPEALAIATAGIYGPAAIRGEIPGWATGFLERVAGAIRIDAGIRAMVRFTQIEVTASGIQGPYDVIFCRNVMIYLSAPARTRLVREICAALAPGGVLFVGHAEQFIRGEPTLRPVAAPHAFALQRVDGVVEPRGPLGRTPTKIDATEASSKLLASVRPSPRPSPVAPTRAVVPLAAAPSAVERRDDLLDARALADAGRMAESEAVVRSLIAHRGPSAGALELLGLIRMAANDVPGAKRLFQQSVYLEPERAASLLQLAMISERAGDPHRAAAYWERARRASATQETGM